MTLTLFTLRQNSSFRVPRKSASSKRRKNRIRRGDDLSVPTWNSDHLSLVTYDNLRASKFDIVGLTELHGDQSKWEGRQFIASEPTTRNDSAAGVGIMLSEQMAKNVKGFGNEGSSSVTWVRIGLSMFDIFAVCAYIPIVTFAS